MPAKYSNPDDRRTMKVLVRFKPAVKDVIEAALKKSGQKTLSAFVREAVWQYSQQLVNKG